MSDQSFHSDRAPAPVGAYPHARRAGDLLFLSGVGPRKAGTTDIPGVTLDADGDIVDYDVEVQTKSVFENIRVILEDAGFKWTHIVDCTCFLTNMKSDFAAFNRVYAEHFTTNRPTRTTIEVGALPTPIAVELKVIARLPEMIELPPA